MTMMMVSHPDHTWTNTLPVVNGILRNIHNDYVCEGTLCCIHNPSDHVMKDWPKYWDMKGWGMFRVCPCGRTHPDPDGLAHREREGLPIPPHTEEHCCAKRCCIPEKE